MNKACYYIAFLALLNVSPASAAEHSYPVVEPRAAGTEISKLLADARPDEAAAALARDLHPTPETQFAFDQLTSAFRLLTKQGKADVVDEVKNVTHGKSVTIIIDYLHFPRQDVPVNQFVFLRYTFMKNGNGWMMSNFDIKTSGVFPPPGWGN
jgi:hypothetical protein